MKPVEEPVAYEKTVLSDLQGAWSVFRQAVVDSGGFKDCARVLFHTDEAMSWETVRNLDRMSPLIEAIRNLCIQGETPKEVLQNLEYVTGLLTDALDEFPA